VVIPTLQAPYWSAKSLAFAVSSRVLIEPEGARTPSRVI
jgi:hypothetical protein